MAPKKSEKSDVNFKKGERVKARWSGSNIFYDAKVIEVFQKSCKVLFDDGTKVNVKLADIKSPKAEENDVEAPPKRTSRSRSRSTGRQRSRSRSPARTDKKKTTVKNERKSSERSSVKVEKNKEDSPNTRNSVKKDEVDSVLVKSSLARDKIGTFKEDMKSSNTSSVTTNSFMSKNLYVSLEKEDPAEVRLRTSARLSALRAADYEKSNAISKKEDAEYSEDEESDEEIKVVPKGPSKIYQGLTLFATLLRIILMPSFLLFLCFACTKKQCTILEVPQFYSRLRDMVNALKTPLASIIVFHVAVCILSLIPLGKKVTGFPYGPKKTTRDYRVNGILSLLLSLTVFGVCSYLGLYMNWGFDKSKTIALGSAIYCVFCALVMHVVALVKGELEKESKVPILGNFFNGIYYNPYLFGKIDVKTSFIRAGLIGSVLVNLSILLKFFLMKGYVTIPLGLTAGMQIFFVLDFFIREEKMLSTATYTSDSVGYGFIMTMGFLIPVGLNLQSVYLFIHETKGSLTPHYCYALMVALYMAGYYIYMSSGNLKHNFRSNPYSPSHSDVDSLATSQKKRLICSKMWGHVRHPNYLGLIIMAIAWTLPCGFSHVVPYGPLIMLIVALIFRCVRIEKECKEKYGPAWNNYTDKVHSRLIPYVF